MRTSLFAKSALAALAVSATVYSAPPVEKTGECPTLTRYTAPRITSGTNSGADNWTAFNSQVLPGGGITVGTVQNPLEAEQSINCIQVPTDLKAQLLASEKLTPGVNSSLPLAYMMYFTFDGRGRTWAAEPRDYPYTHDTTGLPVVGGGLGVSAGLPDSNNRAAGGRGRILILTDKDGDGSLDEYKVFYDGLAGPTSLELVKGGIVTTVPPYVYFIPASATNPDTAGGAPVIIMQRMGSSNQNYDTHGQTNSLTWGIDNFLYGGVGYNSCGNAEVIGGNSIATKNNGNTSGCTNGAIWRFKSKQIGADTNLVEIYGFGNSGTNSHGLGQTEDGQWFTSKATVDNNSWHTVRLGAAMNNTLATGYSATNINHQFWPVTLDYYAWEGSTTRKFLPAGYTDSVNGTNTSAVSGHDFYTATLLPQKYRTYSFVCEGMTHLCNQSAMSVNGSTWRNTRMYGPNHSNIFAGKDAWVAPLKVRTGPDGALWVLDWYNYLFLHNPAGPSTNSAWRGHLRHKSRVRLYRLVPTDGSTQPVLNIENADIDRLVAVLGHSNMVWRVQAQRKLLDRTYTTEERTQLLNTLHGILNTRRDVDTAFGTSPMVLHAMWVVNGLKQYTFDAEPTRWDTTFKKLLLHPAWTVRRNAVLAMPATQASSDAIVAQCAVNDVHPHVRIQALASLIARPAPAAPATMVASYRTTDSHSQTAFTAAGATKVTEVTGTERPASCPAYFEAVSVRSGDVNARSFARKDLRFEVRNGGFVLSNSLQLGSGELTVTDLRGKVVFRSNYDEGAKRWSKAEATNLNMPVYFYTFREIKGATFNGRIALASGF